LGSFDLEYLSTKHILLLVLSSVLILLVAFILSVTLYSISKMKKNEKFEDAKVYYNFLILGYKEEYYVWPFVIWIKKFVVASCVVLIGISTNAVGIQFFL
jgi:hypothetical protein